MEAVFLWASLCLLGTYLYLELMGRFSELAPRLWDATYCPWYSGA